MRRVILLLKTSVAVFVAILPIMTTKAGAATFNPNLVIDDVVFSDTSTMNSTQIDNFLNGFAHSCISPHSGFQARIPSGYAPGGDYAYGAYGTAGQVIATAGHVYGVNPQVLITTLEKEQNLVTGRDSTTYCSPADDNNHKYAAAVGYGCPDSGTTHSYSGLDLYRRNGVTQTSVGPTCVNTASKAGFSQQVIRAAWLLKFGQQRSMGNTGWNVQLTNYPTAGARWNNSDDPQTCYGGPMTQGNFKRCSSDTSPVPYDGYITIDKTSTHMDTGATAALYWYTPHFHGNQLFFNYFTNWFGGTISSAYYQCHNATNVSGALYGHSVINYNVGRQADNLTVLMPNQTGSACFEVHTWYDNNYQVWSDHIASNLPAFNPANAEVISAHPNGGRDDLYLIQYRGTASGRVEVHGWNSSIQHWTSHVATNLPAVNPANTRVVAADTNGDGKDEFIVVKFGSSGSGKVEVHGWGTDLQSWSSHIASNLPVINPADAAIITTDSNRDGKDEFTLIKYRNTGSGKIEVHGWAPDLNGWISHIATNLSSVDPANNSIISTDFNGDGRDDLALIKYRGTSSGKVEVHVWGTNEQSWTAHIATNIGQFTNP